MYFQGELSQWSPRYNHIELQNVNTNRIITAAYPSHSFLPFLLSLNTLKKNPCPGWTREESLPLRPGSGADWELLNKVWIFYKQ